MKNFVNFNEKESIGGILARTVSPNFITFNDSQQTILKETITIGPNSKLTLTCDDTWTGPYLSFDSIDWEKLSYVDIKSNSFLTGTGQKVLNQIIANQRKRIILHLCINNSYRLADLSVIQPVWFTQLIFASVFGFSIFGEIPDGWTWAGGILVFTSVLIITYRENYLKKDIAKKSIPLKS